MYVRPRREDTRFGDIRAVQVEQWIRELSEGTAIGSRTKSSGVAGTPRSATVVYRAVGVLAGILDMAVRDGRIPHNVARGAQNLPTKRSEKPRRYLTHSEVVQHLRHTAASLAISSGASVKAVQRMLGHKSAAMTLDSYADLFEDDLADVAARPNQGAIAADVGRVWTN